MNQLINEHALNIQQIFNKFSYILFIYFILVTFFTDCFVISGEDPNFVIHTKKKIKLLHPPLQPVEIARENGGRKRGERAREREAWKRRETWNPIKARDVS